MHSGWKRWQRRLLVLGTGGVTFGWIQGFSMVNQSWIWTGFLQTLFSGLIRVLFGFWFPVVTGTGNIA